MKFIDLFSGVGGFTRGLELAGHKCIGHCELDKFAEASYRSMHTITEEQRKYLVNLPLKQHTITEEQRKYLVNLPLKQRQKEILKEKYLNGEWYESDIKGARNIPKADMWTFGAPCQDFSIAGKKAGLDGGRSSLVREVFRLLGERQKEDRPEWIIYENVKGMLSSNRGGDYLEIISSLDELGYDVEWQNINSKWFVPHNRERIYTIGHLRGRGGSKILPIKGTSGENHFKQLVQGGQGAKTRPYAFGIDKSRNNPKVIDIANCITAREDSGVSNRKSEGTAVAIAVWSEKYGYYLAIRKLTPKECFRLQGWEDEYFKRAEQFNSNSQLYKQAGNGVTVPIVKEIGEKIRGEKKENV